MQMSMHKLNSHTILQNYPLWCCCHIMYKLLYPGIMVKTAPPVSATVRAVILGMLNEHRLIDVRFKSDDRLSK